MVRTEHARKYSMTNECKPFDSTCLTRHASRTNDEVEFFLRGIFNRHVCHNLRTTPHVNRYMRLLILQKIEENKKKRRSLSKHLVPSCAIFTIHFTHLDSPTHFAYELALRHNRRGYHICSETCQRIRDTRSLDFFRPVRNWNQYAFRHSQCRRMQATMLL